MLKGMKNVIVSLSSDSIAMRECIIGVFNYVNEGHDWKVEVLPDPLGNTSGGMNPQNIAEAIRNGLDGVITGLDIHTEGFRRLVSSGIPLALNSAPPDWHPDKNAPIALVHNDDIAVGRMGARYLRGKGNFRTFAFVALDRKCSWSTYRKRGFGLELAKWGIAPKFFHRNQHSLAEWLLSLPKPAAVMTADDRAAVNVVEACRYNKIKVPEQVAVLGVDNDLLYCSVTRPALSSIHPNHVEMGRRAAAELDRLMHARHPRKEIYIPPIGVIERESTRTIPPSGHLIREALSFIKGHYNDCIAVKDVARHVGVSESLLRLRFRNVHGKSVQDTILTARLESAQKMLLATKKPIAQIAEECGFPSACRMSHFFAEKTGMSPRAWRHAHC